MPNVERECVTHHYACDCREKVLQDYIRAREKHEDCLSDMLITPFEDIDKKKEFRLRANLDDAWEALKKLKHE